MRCGLGHYGGSYNLGNFGSFHNADDIFRPEKENNRYNFLLFTSEKTRQPQESKRCNRILNNCTAINHEVVYGTRILPRTTRVFKSTKIFPKFPAIVSAQNKLTAPGSLFGRDTKMKLLEFVFFTFLSRNLLRFGQFQISRSTLCFTLPPKNRLSNVDFSWGLQTSQKRTANNNC